MIELSETSTPQGEAIADLPLRNLSEDSAAEALLSRWNVKEDGTPKDPPKEASEDAGKPPQAKEKEKPETQEAKTDAETPSDEGETEETAETSETKKYVDDDEVYTKIKVGEEEIEVPVKDLKRLYGQEAALTRRSQETAELRKRADAETAKALSALQVMTKRAQERAAPYKSIDFLTAAQHLSAEDLNALRTEAQRVLDEEKFLSTELDGFMGHIREQTLTQTRTAAKACVAALQDQAGPYFIDNWSDKHYDGLRAFAVQNGVDRGVVDNLVDPAAIKLLDMAWQFSRAKDKVTTTKVNKTPKKIVKTTKVVEPPSPEDNTTLAKKHAEKARRSGKVEDAAEAFLARWNVSKDS